MFNELAMGMRSIIAMVSDMVFRLTNSTFEFEMADGKTNIGGIVLIDEFDAHLHPSWQRGLVEKLTNLFPRVQFIVSTHSPIPLLGAPPERTVILNVNRTKEEGITVNRLEKLEKELKYLTPNLLLSSVLFDYSDILSVANKVGDDIYTEDTFEERDKNEKIKDELKSPLAADKKRELLSLIKKSRGDESK